MLPPRGGRRVGGAVDEVVLIRRGEDGDEASGLSHIRNNLQNHVVLKLFSCDVGAAEGCAPGSFWRLRELIKHDCCNNVYQQTFLGYHQKATCCALRAQHTEKRLFAMQINNF